MWSDKEDSNKRRNFRQGGGPEPTGRGSKPKKGKKRLITIQERYVGKARTGFMSILDNREWSGWNNQLTLKLALESFVSKKYDSLIYEVSQYEFRIINKKTKEILLDYDSLSRIRKGVLNGIWTIDEYLRDEHPKE